MSVAPVHHLVEARNQLWDALNRLDSLRDRETHEFPDEGLGVAVKAIHEAHAELGRVYQRMTG